MLYPDTLVGTDSHTTMVNGLGVVGWGVGGIEAEAAMLGQPVYLLMPDVVGVHLHGRLREGVTATDLVLRITELLRQAGVVGKLVEFHGEGAASLSIPDRATLGNMAPEYGATVGFFPVDEQSCRYLRATGRSDEHVETVRRYHQAQGLFGMPARDQCDYTSVLDLDLASIEPSVAGPKRPQDRISLGALKERFLALLTAPDGYGRAAADVARSVRVGTGDGAEPRPGGGDQSDDTFPRGASKDTNPLTEAEMMNNRPTPNRLGRVGTSPARTASYELAHGDVVIAAITSCTNTSNPAVMLAAGLLAKKAVERGLGVQPWVKTSLAPGSRVVSQYLAKTGLQPFLDRLGFQLVGFGCTTCIGNSGPLDRELEEALTKNDIIGASVLSGNRNFEARIHQSVKANFLMSPPLGRGVRHRRTDRRRSHARAARDSRRTPHLSARRLAVDAGDRRAPRERVRSRRVPACLRRLRPAEPALEPDPGRDGTALRMGSRLDYIREPPYFQPSMAGAPSLELSRRAGAGHLRRLDHDRPHQPGRRDQAHLAGRRLSARSGRCGRGLQQLRRASRKPRSHGARDVRQCPHPQPDGSRRRGRRHPAPARRRTDGASTTRPSATAPRACRSS